MFCWAASTAAILILDICVSFYEQNHSLAVVIVCCFDLFDRGRERKEEVFECSSFDSIEKDNVTFEKKKKKKR